MRINSRENCIEAKEIEVRLDTDSWFSAIQVGDYKLSGIEREIEQEIGISIEGAQQVRHQLDVGTNEYIVTVSDDWVRPTRR